MLSLGKNFRAIGCMAMVTIEVAAQSFDIKVKQTSPETRYWRAAWTKDLKAESVMRPRQSEVVTESLSSQIASMAEMDTGIGEGSGLRNGSLVGLKTLSITELVALLAFLQDFVYGGEQSMGAGEN